MARITWDALGERLFEIGLDRGVLYTLSPEEEYTNGVPWNGLTSVSDNNSGYEGTALYTNGTKTGAVYTNEEYGGTINCYTYPIELEEMFGEVKIANGIYARQQDRPLFGLCYRTLVGNDADGSDYGYKLHLVYNARVNEYSRSFSSLNDSASPGEISIPFETFPVDTSNMKPVSEIVIDSVTFGQARMAWLEGILYGSDDTNNLPRLPYPDEIIDLYSNEELTESDWSGYPNDRLFPDDDLYPGSSDVIIDGSSRISRTGSVTVTMAGNSSLSFSIDDFITIPIGYYVVGIVSYSSTMSDVIASSLSASAGENTIQFINTSEYQVATTITVCFSLSE